MRISDWSSDVCSSDLPACAVGEARAHRLEIGIEDAARVRRAGDMVRTGIVPTCMARVPGLDRQIGSASCRERGRPSAMISLVAVSLIDCVLLTLGLLHILLTPFLVCFLHSSLI